MGLLAKLGVLTARVGLTQIKVSALVGCPF